MAVAGYNLNKKFVGLKDIYNLFLRENASNVIDSQPFVSAWYRSCPDDDQAALLFPSYTCCNTLGAGNPQLGGYLIFVTAAALHIALFKGHDGVARELVAAKCDVNAVCEGVSDRITKNGWTALQIASEYMHIWVVMLLRELPDVEIKHHPPLQIGTGISEASTE